MNVPIISIYREIGKQYIQYAFIGWLFGFYGISTFSGYLTPNTFYENSSISINSVYRK